MKNVLLVGAKKHIMIKFIIKKIKRKSLLFISIFCIILIVYTIWDNQHIIIVEQEIVIDNQPEKLGVLLNPANYRPA